LDVKHISQQSIAEQEPKQDYNEHQREEPYARCIFVSQMDRAAFQPFSRRSEVIMSNIPSSLNRHSPDEQFSVSQPHTRKTEFIPKTRIAASSVEFNRAKTASKKRRDFRSHKFEDNAAVVEVGGFTNCRRQSNSERPPPDIRFASSCLSVNTGNESYFGNSQAVVVKQSSSLHSSRVALILNSLDNIETEEATRVCSLNRNRVVKPLDLVTGIPGEHSNDLVVRPLSVSPRSKHTSVAARAIAATESRLVRKQTNSTFDMDRCSNEGGRVSRCIAAGPRSCSLDTWEKSISPTMGAP